VVSQLGNMALLEVETFELRYAAFTALQQAAPSDESIALFRRLSTDRMLGLAAMDSLRSWRLQ
jgi:hypothetical protein